MTLQKIAKVATLFALMALAMPSRSASNASATLPVKEPVKTEDARVQQLLQRLEYIKGLDKSEMTRLEKKALRKEVVTIKKEMKAIKGGVYLSVAAIIIIILLLILLV